jgi:hypothetical protein
MRNAYRIFIGKPEGKRLHGRPGHRWEDNIKMNFRETELEGVDWVHEFIWVRIGTSGRLL